MPFTPLPELLVADLARSGSSSVLELGSGSGAFTSVLRDHGVEPLTLDRGSAAAGICARIRGDALRPPLRGRFSVVVAANLLRHLWRDVAAFGPVAWCDLVADDGCLWILEDEPGDRPPSVRHYRDLQGLLARLDPAGRGALLAHRRFASRCDDWTWAGRWTMGVADNRWPVAADDVADWLGSGVTEPGGEVDRLATAVRRDGLSYGRYWWARWQPEVAA